MIVTLKHHTDAQDVLKMVGEIAGVSTDKSGRNDEKRAINCFKMGHVSVFEHMNFTWYIEGISRACSHQLVRHRIASYTQESQRYVKMDTSKRWYVIPPEIDDDPERLTGYKAYMNFVANVYEGMIEEGIKPEDARYILPNAAKTNIWVTMNLREFASFYNMRSDKAAQWEIRYLAEEMLCEVMKACPELDVLFE